MSEPWEVAEVQRWRRVEQLAVAAQDYLFLRVFLLSQRLRSDRGDVPGWVLVTVMTAGLVTGLWMIADDQLTALLTRAINSVSR